MHELSGRVALVTGGGGAIGGASARALAGAGADVVIVDLRQDAAEARVKAIQALGRRGLALIGDAGDHATVQRLTEAALGALGRVDILVNVAGGGEPRVTVNAGGAVLRLPGGRLDHRRVHGRQRRPVY